MTDHLDQPSSPSSISDRQEAKEQVKIERKEMEREDREKPDLVSACCGRKIFNTDIPLCPTCGEWTEIIDLNKEEE